MTLPRELRCVGAAGAVGVSQRSWKAGGRRMEEPPPSWDAAALSSLRASCLLLSFLTCLFILGREGDVSGAERGIF